MPGPAATARRPRTTPIRPPYTNASLTQKPLLLPSSIHPSTHTHKQAVKAKTKLRPKKHTPSDRKHVGATYPPLPPPPPAFTVIEAGPKK